MFCIIYNSDVENVIIELDNNIKGNTLPLKKGICLIDTEKEIMSYGKPMLSLENKSVNIGGRLYNFESRFLFEDEMKATAIFLKLKIDEMQQNGSVLFQKKTFESYIKKIKSIEIDYPEHFI